MSVLSFEKARPLPNFNDLPHRVMVSDISSLQKLAEMYSWCSVNAKGWNLEVMNALDSKIYQVVFGFEDMADAAIFKVTWY